MKKIAFIHGSLITGGAEKALINLLHFIDYDQYDVTLWLRDNQGELYPQVDSRVKIQFWDGFLNQDYSQRLKQLLREGRVLSIAYSIVCRSLSKLFVKNWYLNYKYHLKSLCFADWTKYDAAIAYQSLRIDDILFLSYGIRAKKKMGWIHGKVSHDRSNPSHETFFREYPKLNHIFCVSEASKELFLDRYPALSGKTSVMYNLQDFDTIRTLADEKVDEEFDQNTIVTVGRISSEKGQDMIPAIAENLRSRGYRFVWYVIGDGPKREVLEHLIMEKDLSETVILLGQKDNPYPYMKKCGVYVQPSYTEGFCLSTFEAKSLRTPIVVTDVSGMREQFSQDEAYFCEPDVESLTRAIEKALAAEYADRHVPSEIPIDFNQRELKKLYDSFEG